jgi:hypothetical protein
MALRDRSEPGLIDCPAGRRLAWRAHLGRARTSSRRAVASDRRNFRHVGGRDERRGAGRRLGRWRRRWCPRCARSLLEACVGGRRSEPAAALSARSPHGALVARHIAGLPPHSRRMDGSVILIYSSPHPVDFYARLGATRIGVTPFVVSPDVQLSMFAFTIPPLGEIGDGAAWPGTTGRIGRRRPRVCAEPEDLGHARIGPTSRFTPRSRDRGGCQNTWRPG